MILASEWPFYTDTEAGACFMSQIQTGVDIMIIMPQHYTGYTRIAIFYSKNKGQSRIPFIKDTIFTL